MTIPRPRLTVRRLMIAVALAGVALGIALSLRRRGEFAHSRAAYHKTAAVEALSMWTSLDEVEGMQEAANHHLERERCWRAAAAHPWLPFEAEPPEPSVPGPSTVAE